MTFEDKAGIVISQLRKDRDRLQHNIEQIRKEIEQYNRQSSNYPCDMINTSTVLQIIDKYNSEEAIKEQDEKEAGCNRISESNNFTLTEEEKIICKMYLEDLDKTGSCNEYKLLMRLIESAKTFSVTDHNMTREERENAINFLKGYLDEEVYTEKCRNAHKMAIKALEQETVSRESYEHEYFLRKEFELKIDKLQRQLEEQTVKAESILGKIRTEIEILEEGITSYHNDRPWIFKDEVLEIIDKYKSEKEEEYESIRD